MVLSGPQLRPERGATGEEDTAEGPRSAAQTSLMVKRRGPVGGEERCSCWSCSRSWPLSLWGRSCWVADRLGERRDEC